jgi:hypothetical protein
MCQDRLAGRLFLSRQKLSRFEMKGNGEAVSSVGKFRGYEFCSSRGIIGCKLVGALGEPECLPRHERRREIFKEIRIRPSQTNCYTVSKDLFPRLRYYKSSFYRTTDEMVEPHRRERFCSSVFTWQVSGIAVYKTKDITCL